MVDVSGFYNEINAVDSQITIHNTAKEALQNAKNDFQNKLINLKNSDSEFDQGDVAAIKKTDVFEGDMATALESKVNTLKEDISEMIMSCDNLIRTVDAELTAIDNKIAALQNEKINWENRLNNALNQT